MLDILTKCQDLLKSVIKKNEQLDVKTIELNFTQDSINRKEAGNKDKEAELSVRENNVSHIENVLEIQKSNGIKLQDIKEQQGELDIKRNAFVTHSEQVKEENIKKTENFKAWEDRLTKQEAELKATQEKLEADKKNMRADIINSLK